jgi:hypothetical protein
MSEKETERIHFQRITARWSLRWVHGFIFPPWENGIMAIDMKGENPTAQIYEIYHMALSIVLFQKLFAQITIFFI